MSSVFRGLMNQKYAVCFTLLFFFVVHTPQADAQEWTGGGDGASFNDANNWSDGTVPGVDDLALILSLIHI